MIITLELWLKAFLWGIFCIFISEGRFRWTRSNSSVLPNFGLWNNGWIEIPLMIYLGSLKRCRRISECTIIFLVLLLSNLIRLWWPLYISSGTSHATLASSQWKLLPCIRLLCRRSNRSISEIWIALWLENVMSRIRWFRCGQIRCSCPRLCVLMATWRVLQFINWRILQ